MAGSQICGEHNSSPVKNSRHNKLSYTAIRTSFDKIEPVYHLCEGQKHLRMLPLSAQIQH